MITLETTRQTVSNPFHETVEELWRGDDEAVRARVIDWVQDPADRIRSQLETLADIYRDRSDRTTMQWRGTTHEFTEFATRDAACTKLEEIYTIHDTFSVTSKEYQRRECAVDLFLEGTHYQLVVSADNELAVYAYENDDRRELAEPDEREAVVTDFFLRSLVAAVRNEERTDEQKAAANADALLKLHVRRYGAPKTVAATE